MTSFEEECWSSGESEPDEEVETDKSGASYNDEDTEDYIYEHRDEIIYDNVYFSSIKNFSGQANIRENISLNCSSPCDFFEYFFDSSLMNTIIDQSNLYREQNPLPDYQNMRAWTPLTQNELRNMIGLSINMGHVRKGDIKNYWSTDFTLSTPVFGYVMSRTRYLDILRSLHFSNNEDISHHPLRKVKPVIDHLQNKFSGTINPGKNLCIDESLLLWKGRLRFKQYLPLKRNRFGIKIFELVDCETGFILGFIIYTGSDTDYEVHSLGVSGDVVASLMRPYFFKGHVLFIDNWYSSPILAEFLHDRDTGVCGTVKKNRKGMPQLKGKLNRGEMEVAHNSTWLVIRWMDKKEVFMITTVHEVGYSLTGKKNFKTNEDIIKPTCVHEYNKNMGGVDNIDRQLSLTESVRKTMRWYRKLFFHLLDLMLSNAHILFKMKTGKNISFPDYRLQVVKALLRIDEQSDTYDSTIDLRLRGRHFPKKIDESKKLCRLCVLCSMSHIRRRSAYECKTCSTTLCITPCFETYHTKHTLP